MVDTGTWPPTRGERPHGSSRRGSRQSTRDRPRSPVPPVTTDMCLDDDDDEDDGLAYGLEIEPNLSDLMMADRQISDLDIAVSGARRGSIPVRQPHPQTPSKQVPHHQPRTPQFERGLNQDIDRSSSEPSRRDKRNHAGNSVSSQRHRARAPPAQALDHHEVGYEDDGAGIVDIDTTELPRHPDESQQDLAERINQLTRTINANAQLCLETSRRMVALAQENKHLAYEAGAQLDTYVLQPALKLGQALRTYCPGVDDGMQALWEYEAQLRKRVVNGLNGRDAMFRPGGGARQGKEVERLKDRLIEQDALLRDSSHHIRKLMHERDKLRKKLEVGYNSVDNGNDDKRQPSTHRDQDEIFKNAQNNGDEPQSPPQHAQHQRNGSHAEDAQLAEQLGELRILVDRLPVLNDIPLDKEGQPRNGDSTHRQADQDEDGDWTFL